MRPSLLWVPLLGVFLVASGSAADGDRPWHHEELRRFPAPEAFQGVAVDDSHFYAIANQAIAKHRKDTGDRVARWENEAGGPIKHLNSGIVHQGKLYLAHSNFPSVPEQSSMEIFDPATLTPLGRHEFIDPPGSLTWIVPWGDGWLACFAHYRKTSDPAATRLVHFAADWTVLGTWPFPPALIERFVDHSSSGGAIGHEGKLFVTGHDARELYVLRPPAREGGTWIWETTLPISAAGQAIAWDPLDPGILYSISRKTREVIVSRVARKTAKP